MFRGIVRRSFALPFRAHSRACSTATQIDMDPAKVNIGWIGTGIMGRSMCDNLLKNGFQNVTVFNRTKKKAEKLVQMVKENHSHAQITIAESPKEVASKSDVIFSIVGYPQDVEAIVFDKEHGMLSELKNGKIFVDCTTSRPSLAKTIANELERQNAFALDAPVSGGDVGAKNGTLSFMIGGQEDVVNQVLPCFKAMGSKYECMGPAGQGQHTKMVNQIFIASGMMGLVEGLVYARNASLDSSKVIELLSGGAAGSWSLSNYGPRILKRDFEPGFYIEHFVKDLNIALEEANEMKLNLPGLQMATNLYEALNNEGYGQYGTQALQLLIEQMSGDVEEEVEDNNDEEQKE